MKHAGHPDHPGFEPASFTESETRVLTSLPRRHRLDEYIHPSTVQKVGVGKK